MEINKLYKHTNNSDVAFEPLFLVSESEDSLTFEGRWVNIILHNPDIICNDKITINKQDQHNWKEINLHDL